MISGVSLHVSRTDLAPFAVIESSRTTTFVPVKAPQPGAVRTVTPLRTRVLPKPERRVFNAGMLTAPSRVKEPPEAQENTMESPNKQLLSVDVALLPETEIVLVRLQPLRLALAPSEIVMAATTDMLEMLRLPSIVELAPTVSLPVMPVSDSDAVAGTVIVPLARSEGTEPEKVNMKMPDAWAVKPAAWSATEMGRHRVGVSSCR